ncbi:hypothetical protein ATY76_31215 [Rhizobium sp. R339]|nr:hypothetical protein [Rhizobium sp. R339]OWV71754.1 hypothetical protein ATY76_31215 [Rhizobium sp. R339]
MKRSRPIAVTILGLTVITASALLLEHTGIFAGVFRTEILARVDDADVARPRPTAVMAQDIDTADEASTQ